MKNSGYLVLSSVLAIGLLTGCGNTGSTSSQPVQGETTPQTNTPKKNQPTVEQDAIKQMQDIASQAKEPAELITYLDKTIKSVKSETADRLFVILDDYYATHLIGLNESFSKFLAENNNAQKLYEIGFPVDVTKIQEEPLKKYVQDKLAGKLALTDNEGDLFWVVDYDALKQYSRYLTDDMKSYLELQWDEYNKPVSRDGSLIISRQKLGERIVKVEKYLTSYKNGIKKTDVRNLYQTYLQEYLSNYRYDAIDEKTMKLLPEVKKAYEQFIKTHSDTKTTSIIAEYLQIINQNKDVIYEHGKAGESSIGDAKPDISKFWGSLPQKVEQVFGA
ncbi:hypothetical protein NW801_19290 [Brevibacillus laterosporus]|uniref:ATP-binding protein n=1 Tax=Brevibacillus halotolerans TaxID=1507437 RepID=A0ABT4I1G3_9BACL|nr:MULTISPECIES: hypothetical protein [Brevibacillus]MCR8987162.1 hypothetical protein [Brevibacillus laterosporus]MCZ0832899.1 hypothetical protein [Brevibacillus halotolerans]